MTLAIQAPIYLIFRNYPPYFDTFIHMTSSQANVYTPFSNKCTDFCDSRMFFDEEILVSSAFLVPDQSITVKKRRNTAKFFAPFSTYHLYFITPILTRCFLLYIVHVSAKQSIYSVYVLLVILKTLPKTLHPKHYKSLIHIFQPILRHHPQHIPLLNGFSQLLRH